MQNMFGVCSSLQSVPLFNTQNVTNMAVMFAACPSLQSVPLFNTIKVTTVAQMFRTCNSLKEIPNFNLPVCTNYGFYFDGCSSITKIPLINTSLNTAFTGMFNSCTNLKEIPALSTAAANFTTDFGSVFAFGCSSLTRCQMVITNAVDFRGCQLSRDAIVEIFNNLVDRSSTTSATITITGNWGVGALSAADLAIATNKNWVVTT
jgi:surface protein